MKYLLYILLSSLAVYIIYDLIKTWIERSQKSSASPSEGSQGLPDLTFALRQDKVREEFARRTRNKSMVSQRSISSGTRQDAHPVAKVLKQPRDSAVVSSAGMEAPCVAIENIQASALVEQGQKDLGIVVLARNLGNAQVNIVSTRLQFHNSDADVSHEYTVRANVGNPQAIAPESSVEIKLLVEIAATASLGKITLIPVVLARSGNGSTQMVNLATSKLSQWRVEPCGRNLVIVSEHQNNETAGVAFALQLEIYRNQVIDTSYDGQHRLVFSISSSPTPEYPQYLDLVFQDGKAITDAVFCCYNTLSEYRIKAKEEIPGGAEGSSEPIVLNPGCLGGFHLDISSPQKNKLALQGYNSLTAIDVFNNIKSDYQGPTTISASEGSISGMAAAGDLVRGSDFQNGVADLTALGLKINLPGVGDEGKLVKFNATGDNQSGHSAEVTILPAIAMAPSATQAMIRRLWGFRRKRIWVVNARPEINQNLEESFQRDYEVKTLTIEPGELQCLTNNAPDVLFLGVGDQDHDGYKILRQIRQTLHMECLPIFFVGPASEQESKISEVLRSGSVYLAEPLSMPALRAMVADMLEQTSLVQGRMPSQGGRIQGSENLVYQVISKIGEGGMGYIYEARRLRDNQKVIIKYLPPRDFSNIKSVVRFVQEAHTVLSFQHENLVAGFDVLMDRNRCFYVMEFIDGKTLEEIIRINRKLNSIQGLRIVIQVARALQSLDEQHCLVHRDIKPSNILVTDEGIVKLVDFGIAKLGNHKLTTVGIILGTPYYLSPEQISDEEITIKSDIYSLGATFYHMVTGQLPFQGPDVYNIIHQRVSNVPRDPRQYEPGLPEEIVAIIMKMMKTRPADRYDSVGDLILDLDRALQCLESGMLPRDAVATEYDIGRIS